MKRFLFRLFVVVLVLAVTFGGYVAYRFHSLSEQPYAAPSFTISDEVKAADLELGHRIYSIRAGCIDCHGTDASGAPVMENGPMGVIRGANITPFALERWSDEEIARAIRYGIHKDGRSLRFMPSFDYVSLSKGDVAALVAYLRSLPPVDAPSHQNTYGPLARVLSVFGKMPVMFPASSIDQTASFAEKPTEGPTAEFGRYLASACIGCHGENMEGGPIPGGDPSWPHAGSARLGANPAWTKESFARMVATGVSPITGEKLRPPMPVDLIRQLNQDEVTALWEYLKTLE